MTGTSSPGPQDGVQAAVLWQGGSVLSTLLQGAPGGLHRASVGLGGHSWARRRMEVMGHQTSCGWPKWAVGLVGPCPSPRGPCAPTMLCAGQLVGVAISVVRSVCLQVPREPWLVPGSQGSSGHQVTCAHPGCYGNAGQRFCPPPSCPGDGCQPMVAGESQPKSPLWPLPLHFS